MVGQRPGIGDFCTHYEILFWEMSQGLLAKRQGGRPISKIIAGNDRTVGSVFSAQVLPLRALGRWRRPRLSALAGGGRSHSPQSSFCIVQPALYCRIRGNHEQGLGIRQAQTRPWAHHFYRELLKPAPHHRMLMIAPDGGIFLLDQVSRPRPVVRAHSMTYSLSEGSLLGIPATSSQVQGGHFLAFRLLQP